MCVWVCEWLDYIERIEAPTDAFSLHSIMTQSQLWLVLFMEDYLEIELWMMKNDDKCRNLTAATFDGLSVTCSSIRRRAGWSCSSRAAEGRTPYWISSPARKERRWAFCLIFTSVWFLLISLNKHTGKNNDWNHLIIAVIQVSSRWS